ncbi:twin-arginine translocase subunit TatC [Candidatus Saccharibacteria bacterium]|nr:twin-arginine translocase subunit TatC [Candidatus Saccharibacteria bacterium]
MIKRRAKKTKNQTTPKQSSRSTAELVGSDKQTFLEHIYELRSRIVWVALTLIIGSAVGFQYHDFLVSIVIAPLHGEKLVYLTPGGGFSFIFTVCLYFGALLTIPVVIYHIYRFLQPVLGKTSRRLVAGIIFTSILLAASGVLFGYFVAVPAAIEFLSTFAGEAVTPNLTAESYLNFVVAYMVGLAALFQLPLLLYIFDYVKPFPPGSLWASQRFVIVGSFIAAAIITPTPDVVNQLIIAVPIIVMYQLGVVAVAMRHKAALRRTKTRAPKSHPASAMVDVPAELVEERATLAATVVTQPQRPTSSANITQSKQPVPKVIEVAKKPRRPIDGFVVKNKTLESPARPLVVPGGRPVDKAAARAASLQSMQLSRRVRSTDGFIAP